MDENVSPSSRSVTAGMLALVLLAPALASCRDPEGSSGGTTGGSSSTRGTTGATEAIDTTTTGPEPSIDGIPEGSLSFTNFDGTTECTLARNLQPTTVEDAARVIRWAAHHGHRVRPMSSPASHSENDIICPTDQGLLLSLVELDEILSIDAEAMRVTVQPGAQMGDVGDALAEQDLALRNTIPIRDLTAAGAIATGAHHTSARFPSGIHDMVVGMEVLDGNGDLQVLEGAEARGAAAHLGLLGAVVSITFQAVPQFKLQAGFELHDDADFESEVLAAIAVHDYPSISWFPSQSTWTLNYLDEVPVDTPGDAYATSWISTPDEQAFLANIFENINSSDDGEAQMCALEIARLASKGVGKQDDSGRSDPEAPVGWSHRIFSSTCTGLECPWNNGIEIFNPEVAIPLEMLPDWIAAAREQAAQEMPCFPINGILMRFSTASDSWMASNAGHDVAYVEWHIARNTDHQAHEKFAAAYDELHQRTIMQFEGRPHWGKNYPLSFAGMDPARYPGWEQFIALEQQLDPQGVFVNPFWDRVLGSVPLSDADGCAIAKDCVCSEDRHCAAGHACVPGLAYADARVCR